MIRKLHHLVLPISKINVLVATSQQLPSMTISMKKRSNHQKVLTYLYIKNMGTTILSYGLISRWRTVRVKNKGIN